MTTGTSVDTGYFKSKLGAFDEEGARAKAREYLDEAFPSAGSAAKTSFENGWIEHARGAHEDRVHGQEYVATALAVLGPIPRGYETFFKLADEWIRS